MFNDKFRISKIFFCLAILYFSGQYNWQRYQEDEITLSRCLLDPVNFDDSTLRISLDSKILSVEDNSFVLWARGNSIKALITPPLKNSEVNKFISVEAIFHKEGYLEIKKYHIHNNRRIKMLLSIIATIIICIMFLKHLHFKPGKFLFEAKNA